MLTIVVVVAAGELVRYLRMPPTVVAAGQLAALLGLVTAVFTAGGWLVVLPGPTAGAQLRALLVGAAQQLRVGLPPVPESTELLCLVVVAIGLVTIAVHILAISAAAPAWAGLVLLCVVSVPIALSDRLLPWWSLALSAVGFALLLAVDNRRRQLAWGELAGAGEHLGSAPAAVAATAAGVVALLVGATVTTVGTGRSTTARGVDRPVNGIGLTPFAALRGQLSAGEAVALFRVRGLRQRTYLRALTLSRFTTRVGWQPGTLDNLVPADGETTERLPLPAGGGHPGWQRSPCACRSSRSTTWIPGCRLSATRWRWGYRAGLALRPGGDHYLL